MDIATANTLRYIGLDKYVANGCATCPYNEHMDNCSGHVQGPCGQQQCWFVAELEDGD